MRDAVSRRAPQPVQPRPHRAAARRRGRRARPRPRRALRGRRHRGRAGRDRAVADGGRGTRRRGHPVGPRLLPRAVGGHRDRRAPVTVSIDASNGYRLDPDVVAAAITPRTRAIVIVDPAQPVRHRADRGRARRARAPRRRARAAADPRRHARLDRHRPRRAVRVAAGARADRERGRDVLGLALLRDGGRADRLPRRPVAAHAQLPAAEGGADAAEHEPDRAARRARGARGRALPRVRAGRSCAATSPTCATRSPGSTASS